MARGYGGEGVEREGWRRGLRVPTARILAWAGPCLPVAALGLPLVVYLPPYYSGTLGLSIGTVGFLFALVRLIDIPLDPLLGSLMDQTRTRFGQFRPWLAGGCLILAAGIWLLFMARPGVTAAEALASLLTLSLGLSIANLAQTSWGARLSADYAERARIFGFWTAFNVAGLLLVLAVPALVLRTSGGDAMAGVQAMGFFVLAILAPTALLAILRVPEGTADTARAGFSLKAAGRVLADRRMLLLLAVDLLGALIPAITGALFIFFFTQVKGYTAGETSILLLFYFTAGLLAAPVWVKLATRIGKHRAVALAILWKGLVQALIFFLPENNVPLAGAGMGIAGLAFAAPVFLIRAMLADLLDAQALDRREASETSRDTTGLAYALVNATAKIGYAAPVGLLYPLLGAFGFDPAPDAQNEGRAITGLVLLFIVPPVAFGLIGSWLAWRWPITADVHARIRARLDQPAG
jgi:GPH family glycoside/pentoside/hexuronide:cation symporter